MYEGIELNRKPFIAAVNGLALGGGFELVLACDLVVASREAEMGLPEIGGLGLLPGGGGTQKLARIVGRNRAKEFLMTGRNMTAEEGYRLGVVNKMVEPDVLLEEALDLAQRLARRHPTRCVRRSVWSTRGANHTSTWLCPLSRPRCRTCTKPKTLGKASGLS